MAQHTGQAPCEDGQIAVQAKASEKDGVKGAIFKAGMLFVDELSSYMVEIQLPSSQC